MKFNNEIRESIVTSPGNTLGEDIMDRKIRLERLRSLGNAYLKTHNDVAILRKELVDYYVFISAVNRYEGYIEALKDDEDYELFDYERWR